MYTVHIELTDGEIRPNKLESGGKDFYSVLLLIFLIHI